MNLIKSRYFLLIMMIMMGMHISANDINLSVEYPVEVQNGSLASFQHEETLYLAVSATNLHFNPNGSTQKISVESNVEWTVNTIGGGDWLTVTPASGCNNSEISVTASTNEGSATRMAKIIINADGLADQVITVTQYGSGLLTVSKTSLYINSIGSTQKVPVSSNVEWNVTIEYHEGGCDWLTVTPLSGKNNGELEVSVTDNPNGLYRYAEIIIGGGGLEQKISVTNGGGKCISIDKPEINFLSSNSCQSFRVGSNIDWNIDVNYIDGDGWLTVSSKVLDQSVPYPYTNTEVEVNASENTSPTSRTAIINVTGSIITKTVGVIQEGNKSLADNITDPVVEQPIKNIYSVSGIKIKRLQKGLNIIVLENGKVVKVAKK